VNNQSFTPENGAIIFDCDGVIFDSNELKSQAFYEVLSHYPEWVRTTFINYHKIHGGVSRYIKFQYLFTNILEQEIDDEKLNQLLHTFGDQCRKLYAKVPLTVGCHEVLQALSNKGWGLYIASGSDEIELREVFLQRGLFEQFQKILGSPKCKTDCVAEALRYGNHPEGSSLMIGDSVADWQAAKANKVRCILMTDYSESKPALKELSSDLGIPLTPNLPAMLTLLDQGMMFE
jgi:phosphoglycolate phosphatase-like HAD superfamily hydrolase